jgi:hypothetical protein
MLQLKGRHDEQNTACPAALAATWYFSRPCFFANALGMETQQKGSTYMLELDKHTQKTLIKKLKCLLTQVQRDVFVVISEDDCVITTEHKH